MDFYKKYNPITATPFAGNDSYMEFAPCDALKPFIRCFWGTHRPLFQKKTQIQTTGIVTPDTCMDIMFDVYFTGNRISNSFCGINDRTFSVTNHNDTDQSIFLFAIRFYAWSVVLFSEESMSTARNVHFDTGFHFSKIKKKMEAILFDVSSVYELIPQVEKILLESYNSKRENAQVFQAVAGMLESRGKQSVSIITAKTYMSEWQLERLFREYVGVTPKKLAAMIRYQYLWNDIAFQKHFDIRDAVYQYGYSDQAHLCHEFKKYHSMNIADAKKYAFLNVGKLQAANDDLQ